MGHARPGRAGNSHLHTPAPGHTCPLIFSHHIYPAPMRHLPNTREAQNLLRVHDCPMALLRVHDCPMIAPGPLFSLFCSRPLSLEEPLQRDEIPDAPRESPALRNSMPVSVSRCQHLNCKQQHFSQQHEHHPSKHQPTFRYGQQHPQHHTGHWTPIMHFLASSDGLSVLT